MSRVKVFVALAALLVLAAAFGGCGATRPALTPTAIAAATYDPPATATPAPSATSTPAPSATATPNPTETSTPTATATATETATPSPTPTPVSPLSIEYERRQTYPGSEITIEQTLTPGANYQRYIASYRSEGLKIYALLTVPNGPKPATGWPVIIFNHGYIAPAQYRTTERYVAYVDALAQAGYIVFKSDYRGHGSSEGRATGGYGSPDYTTDVLNAVASIQRFADADPHRIGMWGHSMGGQVTLRAMVISKDIKAGVIWSGVVGTYPDIMYRWRMARAAGANPPATMAATPAAGWRSDLASSYGTPEQNPAFWASISPNTYVADLSGPLQLHHATTDPEVPVFMSQELYQLLQKAGKTAELYTYQGDDHNLSQSFSVAMSRTIAWFDQYVKGPATK
jgi:fermentation-respiration switch protein FrsA (DUF1100 family)